MPENDKPIFPRSSDADEAEKQKLHCETKLKLENAEQSVGEQFSFCETCGTKNVDDKWFCLACGSPLNKPQIPTISEMYEPPPIKLDERYDPPAMYGPPPISIVSPKFWLIVGIFILLGVLVFIFVFRR
jgi:hypothetical protein